MSPTALTSAASHDHPDQSKPKKKKRKHRDDEQTIDVVRPDAEPRKKKKHKKSTRTGDRDNDKDVDNTEANAVPSVSLPMMDANTAMSDFDSGSAAAMAGALLSALVAASNGEHVAGPSNAQDVSYPSGPFPVSSDSGYPMPQSFLQPDLPFGDPQSNEMVMKALQELDLSKITNVLRSLEAATPGASLPFGTQAAFIHPPIPTPVGQVPPSAQSILAPGTQPLQAASEGFTSGDHAYMLANKWLSTTQLAELVKSQGLVYKKGKFSVLEEQQLNSAIEQYRQSKGLSEDQLHDVIFPKDERNRENAFWSEITAAVPQRPIIAVYHHVRRSHHPLRLQGKWTPEEDSRLRTAVMHYGQQWQKVSVDVGRGGADCRDRYRNHIVNKDTRVSGSWSKEEEESLTRIVTEMTLEQGRDADNDIFWGVVAQKMGGKRTRAQCRIKWTDSLNLSRKNDGQKPRWGNQDAYILVHKLDALQIVDDTEIDWKTIPDAQWNVWSPHVLQRRWQTMKKSIRGHEYMTHREIMDILKVKKVNSGPSNSSKKRTRKVTSATAIAEGEGRSKE